MMHFAATTPSATLHPADVAALGYTPIPTYPNTHAIAPEWYKGCAIGTPAGKQADGYYLLMLDLDSHTEGQDAEATLQHLRLSLPALAARLAIRRSRSGAGYHLPVKVPFDPNITTGSRLFRVDTGEHVGEVISTGHRVTLSGEWVQGGPESIPTLRYAEWQQLCRVLRTSDRTTEADSDRKARMAEGYALVSGWERVTREQARFHLTKALEESQRRKMPLAELWANRHEATNRSEWFSNFAQGLMIHAWTFGNGLQDRCRVVYRILLDTGALGKEADRDYKIADDAAVLVARIIHGDQKQNGKHWHIPKWYGPQMTMPAPQVAPPAVPRAAGRPAGDQRKQLVRLLRTIDRIAPDDYGRRFVAIDDLATALKVKRRTVQDYLSTLRGDDKYIATGQEGGNGKHYIVLLKSSFGDADNTPKTCKPAATIRGADETALLPVLTPDTDDCTRQCKEEHLKPCTAPAVAALAPAAAGGEVLGVPFPASLPTSLRAAVVEVFDAAGPGARVTRKRAQRYLAANYPELHYTPATLDRLLQIVRVERQRQQKLDALVRLTMPGLKAQLRLAEHLAEKSRATQTNEWRWWEFYRAQIQAEMKSRPVEPTKARRRGIVEAVPSPRRVAQAEQRDMLDQIDAQPQPKAARVAVAVKLDQPNTGRYDAPGLIARLRERKAVIPAVLHV